MFIAIKKRRGLMGNMESTSRVLSYCLDQCA
jgi:hypothetical protein